MNKILKKGLFLGAAVFAIFCLNGNGVQAARAVPKKLILSDRKVVLYTGEEKKLFLRAVKPKNASKNLTWKSENPKIVSVTKNGNLRAKKNGTTQVIARAEKNRKAAAKVRVVVKKHPKRVEKSCTFTNEIVSADCTLLKEWGTHKIIRSKLELEAAIDACGWAKRNKEECAPEVKSILKKYKKTDFSKKSLVLYTVNTADNEKILSVETQLDREGKLCGRVQVWNELPWRQPWESVSPAIGLAVLEMDKKDAAMIDYYTWERLYAQEEESHAALVSTGDWRKEDGELKVSVEFQNKGTESLTYTRSFWVEKLGDREWIKIPVQNDRNLDDATYQLLPGQTALVTFTLYSDREEAPYKKEDFGRGGYRLHVDASFAKERYRCVDFYLDVYASPACE